MTVSTYLCAKIWASDPSNKRNSCLEILGTTWASSNYAPKGLFTHGDFSSKIFLDMITSGSLLPDCSWALECKRLNFYTSGSFFHLYKHVWNIFCSISIYFHAIQVIAGSKFFVLHLWFFVIIIFRLSNPQQCMLRRVLNLYSFALMKNNKPLINLSGSPQGHQRRTSAWTRPSTLDHNNAVLATPGTPWGVHAAQGCSTHA